MGYAEANDRLSGEGLRSTRNRRTSNASQEGYGTSAVLPERGIYLTSAVYRPILQAHLQPPCLFFFCDYVWLSVEISRFIMRENIVVESVNILNLNLLIHSERLC